MSRVARLSTRIDEGVARRLEDLSARSETNKSRLAERYIDEGMRMDEHPGILFRDGPAGRRAALAGGPDVWEVIDIIRDSDLSGEPAVVHAGEWLDLSSERVRAAVRYYSHYPDEVDARIERNRARADMAEADWRREQAALA
ncbi:MAG: hypothetical protein WB998_03890 [Solirubrobacteraceae bacterium]